MEHKEKISIKLKNCSQLGKLYQNILSDLKTVQEAKKLFGYDCFTEDSKEKIKLIKSLKTLYEFCDTVEFFNKEIQMMIDSAPCDKTARRLKFYITRSIKQLEKEGADEED